MDTKFAQALHMLVYISETKGIASSQALAESVGTNSSHIRKLTGLLKQAGLVESQQGKAGFVLRQPKSTITLADIYRAVYPEKHLFHVHEDPSPACPIGQHIGKVLSPTFHHLEQQLIHTLAAQTLDEFVENLYQNAYA